MSNQAEAKKQPRPPIVAVMGHVDHGKTSLLDYIRKSNVVSREAGGITQATGAYEITHSGKRITFIDTPGHEAFSKMRSRGARVADLAILVVAADDGVKPQTKESVQILKESKTPFVVAINKIDKNNSDPERVKQELAQNEVLLEGYGGDVSFQLISAKTGEGINDLLDLVLLAAELQELQYNPVAPGKGFVIEAKLDKRRGNEVLAIIKDGMLRQGDPVYTTTAKGKAKSLQNFLRESVKELSPSSPALILGFEVLPQVGEEFLVGNQTENFTKAVTTADKTQKKKGEYFAVILKADTAGSLEAASQILKSVKDSELSIEVFSERVGVITDGDIKDAIAAGAAVLGFNVKPEKAAETLAVNNGIKIIASNIIYDLVKKVEEELKNMKTPKPLGVFETLALFSAKGNAQLIGGRVLEGDLKNKAHCDVLRNGAVIGTGRIASLKIQKQDAGKVEAGKECGVMFESGVQIQAGDKIIIPPPLK